MIEISICYGSPSITDWLQGGSAVFLAVVAAWGIWATFVRKKAWTEVSFLTIPGAHDGMMSDGIRICAKKISCSSGGVVHVGSITVEREDGKRWHTINKTIGYVRFENGGITSNSQQGAVPYELYFDVPSGKEHSKHRLILEDYHTKRKAIIPVVVIENKSFDNYLSHAYGLYDLTADGTGLRFSIDDKMGNYRDVHLRGKWVDQVKKETEGMDEKQFQAWAGSKSPDDFS